MDGELRTYLEKLDGRLANVITDLAALSATLRERCPGNESRIKSLETRWWGLAATIFAAVVALMVKSLVG